MDNDTKRPYKFMRDRFEKQSRLAGEKILEDHPNGKRNLLATTHIGNEHIAIPAFLIADPILEPVDKAVYNAIRLLSPKQLGGDAASFPSYRDICRVANISSDATVSRALIILRMMRWVSQRTLSAVTGVMGNVYMTHDHPLDYEIYTEINNNYDELLRSSLTHNHARVRSIAAIAIESYENDLVKTDDPIHTLEQVSLSTDFLQGNKKSNYFSISAESIDKLNSSSNIKEPDLASSLNIKEPKINNSLNIKDTPSLNIKELEESPSLNIKEGDLLGSSNIKEPRSSSRNIKTTTTRAGNTHFTEMPDIKLMNEIIEMFPNMKDGQHKQIGRLVMRCEIEDDRYSAVYEIANRLKHGKTPIHNPMGYLGSLIGKLNAGEYPFSSYAEKHFATNQSETPQEKTKMVLQELNLLRSEISGVANEINALEKMQKESPNDFFAKQLTQFREQLKSLETQKQTLEEKQKLQNCKN